MLDVWCGIRGLCLACGAEYSDVDTCEWYRFYDGVVLLG
jgi:hypothetical protein